MRYALLLSLSLSMTSFGDEIGYIEEFAIAKDREAALRNLIPGTEDYYYYHCLHYQNTEQFEKVDDLLKTWIDRYKYTARVREILNRQSLLVYSRDPKRSLDYLKEQLKLRFDHQRARLGQRPDIPTSLDQKLISQQTLTQRAFQKHKNLSGFRDHALDWLIKAELDSVQLRHLLQRLRRPDYAPLPTLVVKDLGERTSKGFGSLPIHRLLLQAQMDECMRLKPDLRNNPNFVAEYLRKLVPSEDENWNTNPEVQLEYLRRLRSFTRTLSPVHNSLKAHVLFHRLRFDMMQGDYDNELFIEYLKLPRNVFYVRKEYLQSVPNRRYPADLNASFKETLLNSVRNDEPLVRGYLENYFKTETSLKPFESYVDANYLNQVLAETKLLYGLGDSERWVSMLPPSSYQALKDRVDLAFAATNKRMFRRDEAVHLDVFVKNVTNLIVKVYRINAANYYRKHLNEIRPDMNLDGLVANEERSIRYEEAPIRRVARHFEFAKLTDPGVYIIDLIGNGKSSRVVVRKGNLSHAVESTTAGHAFTISDELGRKLTDATLLLGGKQYQPEQDGMILVPYRSSRTRQPIVLLQGDLATLDSFQHEPESYALTAGIHLDREQLLRFRKAAVLIRPALFVNGIPTTLSVLENVELTLTSKSIDGVESTQKVDDLKIFEDRESIHHFQVPHRLESLTVQLSAKVENASKNKKETLSASKHVQLNMIDKTDKVEDVHLEKVAGSYRLALLGRNGESKSHRTVQISLQHEDFIDPIAATLQTDATGRAMLGDLAGIRSLTAVGPEKITRSWDLGDDRATYYRTVHSRVGESIELPYMGGLDEPQRSEFSLIELRGGTFVEDRFNHLKLANGMIKIDGLPGGDFDLWIKESGQQIRIRNSQGTQTGDYVVGSSRRLEIRGRRPLQITTLAAVDDRLNLQVRNADKLTRVHVYATRFYPAFSGFGELAKVRDAEPKLLNVAVPAATYMSGRRIGDEYSYIIDRKYATKFPGNLLTRPGLILNPWAVRKTETDRQQAGESSEFAAPESEPPGMDRKTESAQQAQARAGGEFSNVDFLADTSAALLNLEPDENGIVSIPLEQLDGRQHVHVFAVDTLQTVHRSISLKDSEQEYVDLRLTQGLDPDGLFTEQRKVDVLRQNDVFRLQDLASSEYQVFDSISSIYRLYRTLSSSPHLVEFEFITQWPTLEEARKNELYSKYACHELNFFLYHKDRPFFDKTIKPYLANKFQKTFLDRWLLGSNLESYRQPWDYAQLNAVEKILLAQRLEAERPQAIRHIQELLDLLPPQPVRLDALFGTALESSSMDLKKNVPPSGGAARELSFSGRRSATTRGRVPALGKKLGDLEEKRGEIRRKDKSVEAESLFRRRFGRPQRLYQKLEKTQELAENNYYHVALVKHNAALVGVNDFWRDYSRHPGNGEFLSASFAQASRNFTEMMCALAVLDVPFEAAKHDAKLDDRQLTLTAASPMLVVSKTVQPAQRADAASVLVNQNFFQLADRYIQVGNERTDKFVTDEFLMHTAYGCQVVLTNASSSKKKLDLLQQIPEGAMPVLKSKITQGVHVELNPYHTTTFEFYFYFPESGDFRHYPVRVSQEEQIVAEAEPFRFSVVRELSKQDRESWHYVSQFGSDREVLAFLETANLQRLDLTKIAFRMKNQNFFEHVTSLLHENHRYDNALWSYSVFHDHPGTIKQFLEHQDGFVNSCGTFLQSRLLDIDPFRRRLYEHLDYAPFVNARAHQLGKRRNIVNDGLHGQYHELLRQLSYRRELSDDDRTALTYYLLLQDRIVEALDLFAQINPDRIAARLQFDYLSVYIDMYTADLGHARQVATAYASYPVDRWRKRFAGVVAQLNEIEGNAVDVVDPENRSETQAKLAAAESVFDFAIKEGVIDLRFQNLKEVRINYYKMDIELLFSRNPFVQQFSDDFSFIFPNASQVIRLDPESNQRLIPLPKQFENSNVLVELVAAGRSLGRAHYSHSLQVQLTEAYGQLRVSDGQKTHALPRVYVKVYARLKDGRTMFYKDGYTDLRGRFDYTSLSTNELEHVERFSILVLSEQQGALVREAAPPTF